MAAGCAVKKVCINGRFLTQAITGVQRYAREMVRAIDEQLSAAPAIRQQYAFTLLTPRQPAGTIELEHIPTLRIGRLRGHAWEQLELPFHAGGRLILNLCNTAPLAAAGLVTIHDASVFAVPEAYSRTFGLWYRSLFPLLGKRARSILTVSAFSRGQLIQHAGIPAAKIRVVPEGSEHLLRSPGDLGVFARAPVQPGRYILAVGSLSPHKNLIGVVKAVSRLGTSALPLVAAGGGNKRVFNQAGLNGESFHAVGYVTDRELRALYEHAACFVFPSLYEGFGLPPLEAMTCGCPVVVSRAAALPEVCGPAVLYCDPHDPENIAEQIRTILDNPAQRAELRERGLARARCFTWEQAASALLGILGEIDLE
jgi:glycosyltransferase involved in cell wall biosynthesis